MRILLFFIIHRRRIQLLFLLPLGTRGRPPDPQTSRPSFFHLYRPWLDSDITAAGKLVIKNYAVETNSIPTQFCTRFYLASTTTSLMKVTVPMAKSALYQINPLIAAPTNAKNIVFFSPFFQTATFDMYGNTVFQGLGQLRFQGKNTAFVNIANIETEVIIGAQRYKAINANPTDFGFTNLGPCLHIKPGKQSGSAYVQSYQCNPDRFSAHIPRLLFMDNSWRMLYAQYPSLLDGEKAFALILVPCSAAPQETTRAKKIILARRQFLGFAVSRP
ncbi:hypothetical protein PILCRDRAFT_83369 [Piloderma croceum F 1598]|uniref:Peptidase A1 domain-containing protein n=1 Tax=Piloderma croceum (strain F 1598) TaxID=765440 RepID=A0A0C3GNB5_PILCF|nr:hypothetical protein PILCRDRAFT_83369 [Piloderma croceum F 1598]